MFFLTRYSKPNIPYNGHPKVSIILQGGPILAKVVLLFGVFITSSIIKMIQLLNGLQGVSKYYGTIFVNKFDISL